ncbi:MAG: 30S ribosomal protein S16 [Thermomicrobiales bacterium]|jgi:small subunit ribosomal protein S16|nr:30S ribosomal protein S16 [Thermomicrobiales bacterium]
MVKIRLRRMGAKKQPSYRIVVADARAKRDGRFIEIVGFYNPLTEPTTIRIDADRARYWLGVGAQPTDRVAKLLKIQGVTDEHGKVIAPPATEAEAAPAS